MWDDDDKGVGLNILDDDTNEEDILEGLSDDSELEGADPDDFSDEDLLHGDELKDPFDLEEEIA
jgi:hypothetical protein